MADLIGRQAAIDAVRLYYDEQYANTESIEEMIEKLPSAQPEQRWIPCSEKLPDEDYWTGAHRQYSAEVLMTAYNAEDEKTIIDFGHTVDGSWYSETMDCFVPSRWKVLAWMPLPEPWGGEQND